MYYPCWYSGLICLLFLLTSGLAHLLCSSRGKRFIFSRSYGISYNSHQKLKRTSCAPLFGADKGTDLVPTDTSVNLDEIGNDLEVPPPKDGITKIVMKFGGSSVSNAERVTYVAKLIKKHIDLGYTPIIVVSAMGKTTNSLLSSGDSALNGEVYIESLRNLHLTTARTLSLEKETIEDIENILNDLEKLLNGVKMLGELSPRTKDALVSFGERMSVRIMAATLTKMGVNAQAFDAWNLGMRTTSEFGNAEIVESTYEHMKNNLAKYDWQIVPVVTGFIGHDDRGLITTLGRGGSDLTASVLGAAAPAQEIQVWKDVDGILTTDPRIAKAARPVGVVTYEEAAEMAYFGAEVLHPIAMNPATRSKIPMRVKNSYNPEAEGTLITFNRDKSDSLVTVITAKSSVRLVDIVSTRMLGQYGFLGKVFAAFDKWKISVDVVASSEVSLSLTLDEKQAEKTETLKGLIRDLGEFSDVQVFEIYAPDLLTFNVFLCHSL